MIRLYSQVLLDSNDFRLVSQSKLAYGILVANLNSFVFEHINKLEHKVEFDFKKLMVKQFLCLNDKVILLFNFNAFKFFYLFFIKFLSSKIT